MSMLDSTQVDLARRWLSLLISVPASRRAALVKAVESRFHAPTNTKQRAATLTLTSQQVQRDGYFETVIRSFEAVGTALAKPTRRRLPRSNSAS